MHRGERTSRGRQDAWKGLSAGLIGGVAGSLAMAALQGLASSIRGGGASAALDSVAGDVASSDRHPGGNLGLHRPSNVRAVRLLGRFAAGWTPDRRNEARAGRAFHFAFGAALGGAYGVLVEYAPWASTGLGLPFGVAQVLMADETTVPAMGLSGPPAEATASAHASSLLAHSGYGLVTELVRRSVRSRI